jgi:transposase
MGPFSLPGWDVTRVEEAAREYRVEAACVRTPGACPRCQATAADLHRHGSRRQRVADLPHNGKPVSLVLTRLRLRCRACGRTLLQPLPGVDARRSFTQRLARDVERECRRRPTTSIAAEVGLSEKTVRALAGLRENRPTPTAMSFLL